jgi:hypothetical protein
MKKKILYALATTILVLPTLLFSFRFVPIIPLENSPSWISADLAGYATGAALADLDNDGWLDFIVANGNDMGRQNVAVYYNNGTGTFPTVPDWTSLDIGYHGHLSVGDLNKDGWNDVAVSLYLGPGGFDDEGWVKVYMNDGTGELERNPSWSSSDRFFTFSCSFGDADGDGDLDLAVATGESYYNDPLPNRIFYNVEGVLEDTPSWMAVEYDHSYDVVWGDVDNDGDLDLAFTCEETPNKLYLNNDGIISTTADWLSADASMYGNTLTWGDVNGDGWLDLAVADNYQLGGTGKFKVYFNDGAGTLATTPGWQSSTGGYGSSVAFIDIDNDGDRDLASGRWWSPAYIYENTGSSLMTTPSWTSLTSSVIEAMVWGDVDRDGLRVTVNETHEGDGVKKVFYVDHAPVHTIMAVRVGNTLVPPAEYCYDLACGWLSLSFAPDAGEEVGVTYRHTTSPDLGISNWDSDEGNYTFFHDPVEPWTKRQIIPIPRP